MTTYSTSWEACQDVFIDIELLYNPNRKRGKNGMLSPIDYVRQQKFTLQDIWEIKGR
jgi:putative transposase